MVYAVPSAGLARSTEVQLSVQKEENKGKKKKHEEKDKKKPDYEQSHASHTSVLYLIVFREIYGRVVTLGVKTASSDNQGRRS